MLAAPLGTAFEGRQRDSQHVWKEAKGCVASWVSTPTGRRPSKKETPPGAEDHNPATIVKPDMGAVEKVRAERVQRFIQALLEEEVTALRERPKFTRRAAGDLPEGRNLVQWQRCRLASPLIHISLTPRQDDQPESLCPIVPKTVPARGYK